MEDPQETDTTSVGVWQLSSRSSRTWTKANKVAQDFRYHRIELSSKEQEELRSK